MLSCVDGFNARLRKFSSKILSSPQRDWHRRSARLYTLITSVSSSTAAADFFSAASSSGISMVWVIVTADEKRGR